jgi:hypothetical protein
MVLPSLVDNFSHEPSPFFLINFININGSLLEEL